MQLPMKEWSAYDAQLKLPPKLAQSRWDAK